MSSVPPVLNLLNRSHLRKGPGDCPGMGEWLGEREAGGSHTVELYGNEQAPVLPSGFLPGCCLEGLSETVMLTQIREDPNPVS